MTKKLLGITLILLTFSCAGYSNKTSYGYNTSSVRDLKIDNIENLKESKSCMDGSIGYLRLFASLYGAELSITANAKLNHDDIYQYFAQILADKSGDASISSAAKLGGISKVKMVDHSYSITGIMSRRYCVIVYGE